MSSSSSISKRAIAARAAALGEPCMPCDIAWALVFALIATMVVFVVIGLVLPGALA